MCVSVRKRGSVISQNVSEVILFFPVSHQKFVIWQSGRVRLSSPPEDCSILPCNDYSQGKQVLRKCNGVSYDDTIAPKCVKHSIVNL